MDKVSRRKRFYDTASAEGSEGAGYHITLDGRPLRTPQKALLCVPGEALAMAIAQEWQAQGKVLDLQRMMLTRLANVVIDRTPQTRADLAEEFVNYAMTDVVCYLAVSPRRFGRVRRQSGAHCGTGLVRHIILCWFR